MRKTLLVSRPTEIYFDSSQWNISRYVRTCLSRVQQWHQNAKTRKQLADMPSCRLRDIGLTESQARCEMQKKFWQ